MKDFAVKASKVKVSGKGCLKHGSRTVRRPMDYENEI
jgi:hypothetical protein